jgi:hypothetical protein
LRHHDFGWHALFEHDDDAIAPAAGRQDVDRIAFAGAASEKDADRVHAARLEHVGRRHADPVPQAAPFRLRAGHEVFGLAGHGDGALPVTRLDGLRCCFFEREPPGRRAHDAKSHKPPSRQA